MSNYLFKAMVSAMTILLFSALAVAQSNELKGIYDASSTVLTNVAGVRTFNAPPEGFNALAASDGELATYGFPPRPNQQDDPAEYARWAKAMAAAKIRWNGELKQTGLYSGPARAAKPAGAAATTSATTAAYYYNWSGFINTNSLTAYNPNTSFSIIYSEFNVPTVSQAVNACDGGWDWEVSWNGIDGSKNGNALLQGGSASGAFCSGSVTATSYYAWVEWYPAYPMLQEFNVSPGDDMYVATWDTSPTQGYVFVIDMTKSLSYTAALTPNGGPGLIGNSAEYVVERPCCRGANDYPLPNYVWDFWANSSAYTFAGHAKGTTAYYPGSTAANNWLSYMVDDKDTQVISAPAAQGKYGIFFEAEHCAIDPGCTP
jgi:Peptidase A4 family